MVSTRKSSDPKCVVVLPDEKRLLKERTKARDESLHNFNEVMERHEKRLTLRNLRFAERFRDGELRIILHFGAKDAGEGWVVSYQPVLSIKSDPLQEIVVAESEKKSMLINVVELMELPERVVPALVRFERVDSFYRFWPHSLYFSNLRGFIYLGAATNGECDLRIDVARVDSSDEHELVCKVVKSAAEILDNVSGGGKQVKRGLRDADRAIYINSALPSLRVILGPNCIRVRLAEFASFGFQLNEVLFGPFDLYPDEHKPTFSGQ